VPEIGQPISDVIEVAMRLRPEERYSDAGEMFEAWEAAVEATQRAVARSSGALPDRAPGRRERAGRPSATTEDVHDLEFVQLSTIRDLPATLPPDRMVAWGASSVPRWLWWVGSGILAVVATIAFGVARMSSAPAEPPRFIVVQGSAETGAPPVVASGSLADIAAVDATAGSDAKAEASPVSGQVAPAAEAAGPTPPTAAVGRKARPASRPPKLAPKSDPEALVAQAFLRQKQGVVRCLEKHAEEQLPKLSVRMRVDARGRVEEVAVLPSTVGRTSVGNCIEQAVSVMRFTPQPQAATYRVPLVARRGS